MDAASTVLLTLMWWVQKNTGVRVSAFCTEKRAGERPTGGSKTDEDSKWERADVAVLPCPILFPVLLEKICLNYEDSNNGEGNMKQVLLPFQFFIIETVTFIFTLGISVAQPMPLRIVNGRWDTKLRQFGCSPKQCAKYYHLWQQHHDWYITQYNVGNVCKYVWQQT